MGISRRLREKYPDIRVIGVEPPPGDSIQGLKCLGEKLPPFWDSTLITDKARVTSQEAAMASRQLLEKEGIFAGQSSGAVVYQAIKAASEMDEGNIVAVLADAGWKYLSMDFWTKGRSIWMVVNRHRFICHRHLKRAVSR
jgi:cysteine synthase